MEKKSQFFKWKSIHQIPDLLVQVTTANICLLSCNQMLVHTMKLISMKYARLNFSLNDISNIYYPLSQ